MRTFALLLLIALGCIALPAADRGAQTFVVTTKPKIEHLGVTTRDMSTRGDKALSCRVLIINALQHPQDVANFTRWRTCPLWPSPEWARLEQFRSRVRQNTGSIPDS